MARQRSDKKKSPPERWKPQELSLTTAWAGRGVGQYTAFAINSRLPLGMAWVELTSDDRGNPVCEILDIYVVRQFRRLGVARYILNELLGMYQTLRTGTGTPDGGMALLKSMGWKQNRQTTQWYLRGPKKKKK